MYIDTSLIAAYYCPESRSLAAENLLRSLTKPSISRLTEVEFFSALARKQREGGLGRNDAQRIGDLFLTHLEAGYYCRIEVESAHLRLAQGWLAGFDTPLRTLDAIHLAVAVIAHLPLATADRRLAECARAKSCECVLVGQ